MRTFRLRREKDISGVSGTGIVAEGVEFQNGRCVLSWFGRYQTIEIATSINEVVGVHGHGGATVVDWVRDDG